MAESKDGFQEALLRVQSVIRDAEKSGRNKHLGNTYATLKDVFDAARGPLQDNKMTVQHFVVPSYQAVDNSLLSGVVVQTVLHHVPSTGQSVVSVTIPCSPTAHSIAGAITYGRRIGLMCALGIVGDDDDDGNAATGLDKQNPGTAYKGTANIPSVVRGITVK